jgi:hypothetical protein
MDIPNDADGDAMRRVIAGGADITRPMVIDFEIDCPDIESARAIASRVPAERFTTRIYTDPTSRNVTCECSRKMLLNHADLQRIQEELTLIAKPSGGCCEAWGTFGNSEKAQPAEESC